MSAVTALAAGAGPTVRALPTPHDPPAGPVTVATPSCCCCCCCCLNSIGAALGFSIGATTETARAHGRPSLVPTLLAVGAAPLAIKVVVVLRWLEALVFGPAGGGDPVGQLIGVTAVATYVGAFVVAFRLAGAGWARALGVPVVSLVVVVPLVVVEVFAALVTALIVELLVPGAVLLGLHVGRRTHAAPAGTVPPWPAATAGTWGPPPPVGPGPGPGRPPTVGGLGEPGPPGLPALPPADRGHDGDHPGAPGAGDCGGPAR